MGKRKDEMTLDEIVERRRKRARAANTAGLAFAVINIAMLINAHGRRVWVPRVGDWDTPPDVWVSTSAAVSLFQVEEAVAFWRKLGHEFGEVRPTDRITGPVAGAIFVGLPGQAWDSDRVGEATWRTVWPDLEDDFADLEGVDELDALTHTKAEDVVTLDDEDLGTIVEAVVAVDSLLNDTQKMDVLIHEFGHALGYLHCETALLGRRKKDRKNGRAKAGDARRLFGVKVIARKTGHVMHPRLSQMGRIATGLREDEDE